ncbi:UBA-like superfamily [Arabidopsis suecica]|uniref:UBA-like superfamily n=1 Tax=Arabidopsis suecica TaxID=45249 RepID=A0A8T1XNF3_ARASU|nr:UBA-like superfamily [Arabidopsis suecica]
MGFSSSGKKGRGHRNTIPENWREIVQNMKEIVNCSEQDIYAMLVECNMDADEAIIVWLKVRRRNEDERKQIGSFQKVKSKRDKKKEAKDASEIQRLISGSNRYREFQNGRDYYVDQSRGNKLNSYETSNVQGSRNHLAGSSTTAGILSPSPPLNSVVSNVETKRVPTNSGEAVPSLSVPSSRLIPAWRCGTSGQRTMADVVKMGSTSSKESVTKPLVKNDCLLPENPVVPNPFSNSFIESAPRRDQLQESASVSNQMSNDNYNNKNDETYQVKRCSFENNQTKDPFAPANLDQYINELKKLRFGRFGSGINGSGEHSSLPSQFLNGDSEDISGFADDLSLRRLNLRDGECHEEEQQQPRMNVANEQMTYEVNCDQTKPIQENQYRSSSATDFSFYNSQLFNPVMAPSERSLQMQSLNTFPDTMHQQAYTRELDPWYLASPLNQSMSGASSLGRRLSVSMTEMNHHHLYSQPNVPSEHYGNMMVPTSAFQQHGGGNNNAYHLHPLVAPLSLHRNSYPCQPTVAAGTSTRSSAYGSTDGSAYDSSYGFGMLSDNTANLRFEYEDDLHTRFRNRLASLQHQGRNSNMWTPPQGHNESGRNYGSVFPGDQNQQSLSFRHNQQQVEQEETYRRIGNAFERSSRYNASLDQQTRRRGDPSNQTQQQQWPRNNN